jgi:hypothetical protein
VSDTVSSFRAISWLIVKWLLIVTGVLVALTAIGVGLFFAHSWYTHDRHVSSIQLYASFDQSVCTTTEYPIAVVVMNKSSATIKHTSFRLEARVPGRSTNIAAYDSYSDDHIIKPGESFTYCWRVPKLYEKVDDYSKLNWSFASQAYILAD